MNEADDMQTRPKRSLGARIALTAGAAVAGLLAAGLLGLGGLALWGDSQRDGEGYLSTSSEPFEANTRALATENLDVDLSGADWLADTDDFGQIRLEVTPQGEKPVFAGIARTSDVDAYLRGVAHTLVTDVESSPFEASYSPRDGERRAAPPAGESIWAASAQGNGTQELSWEIRDGDWSIVVMNADGSPGVETDISAGAKIGFLDELGWSAVGAGVVLVLVAGLLAALAVRPPRNRTGGGPAVREPVAAG